MTAPKAPKDHATKAGHIRIGSKEFPVRPNLDDDFHLQELASKPADLVMYVFEGNEKAYEAAKVAATVNSGEPNERVSLEKMGEIIQSILEQAAPNS